MRASNGSRFRIVTLSLGLMAGGSMTGCHKQQPPVEPQTAVQVPAFTGPPPAKEPPEVLIPPPAADPASIKKAMATLKKNFADMQQSFSDLSKDLEAIPSDMQGYPQLRQHFYATEEARGVTDAKVASLSARVDAALKSGKQEDLDRVAIEIGKTSNDGRRLGDMYLKLLHQVLAYQRVDDKRKDAVAAANGTPAKKAKAAKAKAKD